MVNSPALEVYLHGKLTGHLLNQGPEVWAWQPLDTAPPQPASAWSLSNLTSTSILSPQVRAWFRGLLPDPAVTARLALKAGFSPGNDFALLGGLGGDCPGALSLAFPGRAPAVRDEAPLLSTERFAECLQRLRDGQPAAAIGDSLWPGDGAVLPLRESPAGFALGAPGHPSNVLLRIARHGLADAPVNEAFCMLLAGRLGVPVVAARWQSAQRGYLVSARPDCMAGANDVPERIHMETFSQLAGLAPEQAFEREGGLALLDCAALIRRYSVVPALDLRSFLRWLGLCLLCGNGLANGNALRFIFTAAGPRLAPFSDLLATHVYPEMSERLGFYVGREDRPDWLLPARWRELAEEIGVGSRYLLTLLRELALATAPALAATKAQWRETLPWSPLLEQVEQLVEKRARQLWVALEAERL